MTNVLCFISDEMADFEVTLTLQILKNKGNRDIITVASTTAPVVSQAGFTHLPNCTTRQAIDLPNIEALIIPGGPIRPQPDGLTELIQKIHNQQKLVAAICFGPQYLGRAGILDQHRFTTSCSEDKIKALQVADPYPRRNYVEARVVCDGNLITAKGGAFVDFAFAVADYLGIYTDREQDSQNFYNEITNR